MANTITWTHVDKLCRGILENRGMLPMGDTDAGVACGLIGFLDLQVCNLESGSRIERALAEENTRLKKELAEIKAKPISRTKQRLAALEKSVAELREHTDIDLPL